MGTKYQWSANFTYTSSPPFDVQNLKVECTTLLRKFNDFRSPSKKKLSTCCQKLACCHWEAPPHLLTNRGSAHLSQRPILASLENNFHLNTENKFPPLEQRHPASCPFPRLSNSSRVCILRLGIQESRSLYKKPKAVLQEICCFISVPETNQLTIFTHPQPRSKKQESGTILKYPLNMS